MRRSPRLRIVVLAAGFSTRLGRPKAFTHIGGMSLLRRTLLLAASFGPVQLIAVLPRVSQRASFEARGLRLQLIANRRRGDGLSSSVRCGVGNPGSWSGLLLLPVDLAFLRRSEIAQLISRWRGLPRQLVARRVGANGGIPLILPRRLKSQALRITGDIGLRDLLAHLPAQQRRLMDLPSADFDVDTPVDLAVARRRRFVTPQAFQS